MSSPEKRGLLGGESPMPTSSTTAATPASPTQPFSARHRPGYARVPSVSFNNESIARDITDNSTVDDFSPAIDSTGYRHGLGIQGVAMPPASSSKARRVSSPLAQHDSASYATLAAEDRRPVMSPPSTGGFSGSTRYDQSFGSDYDTSYAGAKGRTSRTSLQSNAPSVCAKSDAGLLSTPSRYDFEPHNCQSAQSIKHGRFNSWVSIGILLLAIFSTVFSAIFLILALKGPRYGRRIREHGGSLTPSSAAFLTSFFAKMIELSFVTIIVAFIGQALARRAFKQEITRGVTLAEMSMRTWVMQPGTMFTQWESVRYAGITVLGAVSLLAALMALLYTTAATALVQPQLMWPGWKMQPMQGLVKTTFANSRYIIGNCETPNTIIYHDDDSKALHATAFNDATTDDVHASEDSDSICLDMTHVSAAYHNYYTYIEHWTQQINNGNGSMLLSNRPKGYALFNDNTTVVSPWIEQQNITVWNSTRYINNVTMAMPHMGVIQAAIDPVNNLVQPNEVDGAQYNVIASVPSPMVNVICMTLTADDLKPFVYSLWPEYPSNYNISGWPNNFNFGHYNRTSYLNGTKFDDVFGWGAKYGPQKYPPVFPKLPSDYNTVLNDTLGMQWGRRAIYILGKGPPQSSDGIMSKDGEGVANNYALCQLQAGITPSCSTHYNASASVATMEAVCEDPDDSLQYSLSNSDAWNGNATLSQEWPNVASDWARSISMNDGLFDGNSANARQLTQFIVSSSNLSTGLPSIAEALAVLAGCTLIESIVDSSFVGQSWNYTLPQLEPGRHEYFNASIRSQQYASGGAMAYQKAFYPVLFAVFILSFLILIYFLLHSDWYTDFSEPATMFALTLNSPPSEKMAGSCGCGPRGTQYKVPWKLNNDGGHIFVDSHEQQADSVSVSSPRLSRKRWTEFDMLGTPMTNLKSRFGRPAAETPDPAV